MVIIINILNINLNHNFWSQLELVSPARGKVPTVGLSYAVFQSHALWKLAHSWLVHFVNLSNLQTVPMCALYRQVYFANSQLANFANSRSFLHFLALGKHFLALGTFMHSPWNNPTTELLYRCSQLKYATLQSHRISYMTAILPIIFLIWPKA